MKKQIASTAAVQPSKPTKVRPVLDQFYTSREQAIRAVQDFMTWAGTEKISLEWKTFLEPSAGDGSFLEAMTDQGLSFVALDLDPKVKGIQKADFLTWEPSPETPVDIAIGNPPFGKNANLAIAFLNRSLTMCPIVAMILPATLRKDSALRRVSPMAWLEYERLMPPDSFVALGAPKSVPSVFQIWRLRDEPRPALVLNREHPDFQFTTRANAHFAFQRVGVHAGKTKDLPSSVADASHHFIRSTKSSQAVRNLFDSIDWSDLKHRTAGCPSISKTEIVSEYVKAQKAQNQKI